MNTRSSSNSLTGRFSKASAVGRFALLAFLLAGMVGGVAGADLEGMGDTVSYSSSGSYNVSFGPQIKAVNVTLEGAVGGNAMGYFGGSGGETKAKIDVSGLDNVYAYVGGAGASNIDSCNPTGGGFNGGGDGYDGDCGGTGDDGSGGGGATDIRTSQSLGTENDPNRIAVAGGGGGSGSYNGGGNGGGLQGGTEGGTGGTQSSGGSGRCERGSFGFGGTQQGSCSYDYAIGGGGGGWYGGAGHNGGAGGGSGYIGHSRVITGSMTTGGAGGAANDGTATIEVVEVNNPPKLNFSINPNIPLIGENVSYSAEASDSDGTVSSISLTVFDNGTQVFHDSVNQASYNWSDVFVPQSDGDLNARFTATDDAKATTTEWLNRTIDETPPSLEIFKPETPTSTRTGLPLNYSVSDIHLNLDTCKYSKDGGTNFSLQNCGNTSIDFGTVGNHNLTVYASDTYNNTGKASKSIFVDVVNEIRAVDQETGTEIEEFSVTLSNDTSSIGGQAVNGSFRFNTSNAPTGEVNLSLVANGYRPLNKQLQIDKAFSLNRSFSLERAGLYINAKDEKTEGDIQFSLTLSNSTDIYSKEDITEFQEDYQDFADKNISTGEVTASISSSGYQTREYFYSIDENSKISLTPYLLEKNQGIYVSMDVHDSAGSSIQETSLTVQRQFNGEWKTVSQKTTETTGGSSFFLDPETTYRFVASKTGYETFRGTFSPSNYQYDALKIYLGTEETSKYSTILEGVEYNVRPQQGIISGVQEFELNVTDKEGKLSNFGLKAYNETGGLESSSIVQTSPSGGSTNLEVNTSGMGNEVTVETFFQRDNQTYSYKNTFRVLKPLDSGEFSLIQGKRYLEKHLSMFARSLLTIIAVIGVTLPASKSKKLESNGAGAIGLAMLGTATAVNFFPQPIFILTLLPVIGIYLMRIR